MLKSFLMAAAAVLAFAGSVYAVDPGEVVRKSQDAFLYQGGDFKARVMMRLITKEGHVRVREMTMLRKNYEEGKQKYFIYFFQPADVKDMTFMVNKHPARDDDRWLFIPALNMVRRIAAQDSSSSFVGSDFTYEDVSGRDPEDDRHEFLRDETLEGRACSVIKSIPKTGDMDWSHKLTWIDKDTYLPIKEEYYDRRGELYRVFEAEEIKDISGFPTITKRTMKNLHSGHRTEVVYVKAQYDIGIDDSLFSERFLKRPLRKWIE